MIDPAEMVSRAQSMAVGTRLTPLVRSPTRVTCFLFAVAWWTPHRVHYDVDWARHEGYDDVMVPALLLNEYAVTALTSWSGDPGTLRRMTVRNLAPALAGDTITVEPVVAAATERDGCRVITIDFTLTKQGPVQVATGQGIVEVPLTGPALGYVSPAAEW